MQATLAFVQDYLADKMLYQTADKPIVYDLLSSTSTNKNKRKVQDSVLTTGNKDDSLQIRQHDDVRINSIDLVEQRQDGSRARKKLTNETLQQFIESNRKKHLTSFLEQRNNKKRRQRSESPASLLDSGRGKIFHIGCDYRLKPRFQNYRHQGY